MIRDLAYHLALIFTTFVGIGLVISSSFLPHHHPIEQQANNSVGTNLTQMALESYLKVRNSTEQDINEIGYEKLTEI